MTKHAYLIMAHDDFKMLEKLCAALDDKRNDIYIHVDKKSTFTADNLKNTCIHSNLFFLPRCYVKWGGESQIKVELNLLEFSTKQFNYDYYHLLSGHDFPIYDQDYILHFFDENIGCNFIDIEEANELFKERVKYFYPWQEILPRNSILHKILRKLTVLAQKCFLVDRCSKSEIAYYKGANWFSITNEFAVYLLQNIDLIKKYFYKGKNADELFLQTIYAIYNKDNDKKTYNCNLRYVSFEESVNGSPKILTLDDYDSIYSSDSLYIRKVNSIDSEQLEK